MGRGADRRRHRRGGRGPLPYAARYAHVAWARAELAERQARAADARTTALTDEIRQLARKRIPAAALALSHPSAPVPGLREAAEVDGGRHRAGRRAACPSPPRPHLVLPRPSRRSGQRRDCASDHSGHECGPRPDGQPDRQHAAAHSHRRELRRLAARRSDDGPRGDRRGPVAGPAAGQFRRSLPPPRHRVPRRPAARRARLPLRTPACAPAAAPICPGRRGRTGAPRGSRRCSSR
jgi:hypothetical protein